MPNTLLTLAELRAASGNAEGAQQAFLQAIANEQLDKQSVSVTLIDYFCTQKKWPALQGYAAALVANTPQDKTLNASPTVNILKNSALTQIGLCFFNEQHFDEAQKWLQQLDVTQQLAHQAYLALARMAIEQKQYPTAQQLINQHEVTKNKIDAKMLWTAFEVYRALEQSEIANQLGETLYQLSKRYGVTTPELMSWNPNLVIDDISIGTKIRIRPIP
jgi:Tfp pilus assembly protein PilF